MINTDECFTYMQNVCDEVQSWRSEQRKHTNAPKRLVLVFWMHFEVSFFFYQNLNKCYFILEFYMQVKPS